MIRQDQTQKTSFRQRVGRVFVGTLGNERWQFISIPVFAILISLLAAAIVILLLHQNPLLAFWNLLQGSGFAPKGVYAGGENMFTDFLSTLDEMTPMLFAALAVAVALKAGLFNIGVSGQMLAAGFVATVTIGYSGLGAELAKPLVLLVGFAVGAAVGGLIGALKHFFNINEVVSSIMLNYIIMYIVSFFINNFFIDPISRESHTITDAARLTLEEVTVGSLYMNVPLGIALAVIAAIVIRFLIDRTRFGYEMKAVGANRNAAGYAGINVGMNIVRSMVISGGLAGLAGVTYYLGYFGAIQPLALTNVGFDAIAVSLLGNSNPVGIIFSSLLITTIDNGSTYMSSMQGIRQEIASVIIGLILLFSACGAYIRFVVARQKRLLEERPAQVTAKKKGA